ncbi:hypothetical protein M408DRAFT_118192 [Serendipita vermifera MAFF 305830]|uniref:Transmembrane protein n=1 Tax=Serendipita vermifera MAFF 305830 TaxID=933852 RepID=A0A0C2WTW0_SERVB|nr:hypothetical protein M408DRAFT_118192 [Serendipita vermifera MAFF 305830]
MASAVRCDSGHTWEDNASGQDACQQYATLAGICEPSIIIRYPGISSPYLPTAANAPCTCNVVAYNLASGCTWCQTVLTWSSEQAWMQNCSILLGTTYSYTSLPPFLLLSPPVAPPSVLITTSNSAAPTPTVTRLDIPAWATQTVRATETEWNPSRAQDIAEGRETSATNPFGYLTEDAAFSSAFSAVWGTGDYRNYRPNAGVPLGAIVGGVAGGIAGLVLLILLVVCLMRERKRNRLYRPMGRYYEQMGKGGLGTQPAVINHGAVAGAYCWGLWPAYTLLGTLYYTRYGKQYCLPPLKLGVSFKSMI